MDNQNNNPNDSRQLDNNPQHPEQQTAEHTQYHTGQNHQNYDQYQQQQQSAYNQSQAHTVPPAFHHAHKPKRKFRNAIKTVLATISLVRSILVLILLFMLIGLVGLMFGDADFAMAPGTPHFSVVTIDGTITGSRGFGDAGYDHNMTMNYIRGLIDDPNDRGILLYLNTPGGTIFHSDELYLLLFEYREQTGRPVYAYMADMCASGGVYIAMAADYIIANRMTVTGSVGVISTLIDTSELFHELGLRTVIIDSGEHKSFGAMGTEITPSQVAVHQSIIDEYFDNFVSIVATGRNMDEQSVRQFADGRLLSAEQALSVGLIDEIGSWQRALDLFGERTDAIAFHPDLSIPLTFWESMLVRIPVFNRADPMEMMVPRLADLPTGVPLAVAPELVQ